MSLVKSKSLTPVYKIETELGWKADENFDTGIVKTVEWYLNKYGVNNG